MTPISHLTIERLRAANSVVVLTGAGVSAESGVPTFRDSSALWSHVHPEDLASEAGFRKNPELVQGWYRDRLRQCRHVSPNSAHFALAELEALKNDFTLVTQNVDNLHRVAGSKQVIELHGNLADCFCIDCREPSSRSLGDADHLPLRCESCSGYIRPGVVWFGEMLPDGAFERASESANRCDMFLVIGTSGVVYPAAALPEIARTNGACVVEINTEPSALQDLMDESLLGKAGTVVPELVERAFKLN